MENDVDAGHIIEIAINGIENEELRDSKVCFKFINYLLLDEVQFMLRFVEVLNSLLL